MTGPCLCGDPACGRCFPSGQTRMVCRACEWTGKRYECGCDESHYDVIDFFCPDCGGMAEEADDVQ